MNLKELVKKETEDINCIDIGAEVIFKHEPKKEDDTVVLFNIAEGKKVIVDTLCIDQDPLDKNCTTLIEEIKNENILKNALLRSPLGEIKLEPDDEIPDEKFIIDVPNIDYGLKFELKDEGIVKESSGVNCKVEVDDECSYNGVAAGSSLDDSTRAKSKGALAELHEQLPLGEIISIYEDASSECCTVLKESPDCIYNDVKSYNSNKSGYGTAEWSNIDNRLTVNFVQKPFKCNACKFTTFNRNEINKHKTQYTNKIQHNCNFCDYCTNNKTLLRRHLMKHTGEKPFKCSVCNYAAAQKSNLKVHLMRHIGDKPFKCNDCHYADSSKSNLRTHMAKHNDKKPFKCSSCNFSCTNKTCLNKKDL